MGRLQSCHSCGAQFDVSSFAPGQQFTCGSCGTVLAAEAGGGGAPAGKAPGSGGAPTSGRTPGTKRRTPGGGASRPAVQGRTPGSRRTGGAAKSGSKSGAGGGRVQGRAPQQSPAKATRGPQYRPPERRGEGGGKAKARTPRKPAGAARGGRTRRAPEREGYERGGGGGFNPALIYGGGALVVVIVLVFLFVGGGGDDNPTSTAGGGGGGVSTGGTGGNGGAQPVKEPDTIASLKAELRETNLKRPAEYRAFAKRFLDVGGEDGKKQAEILYQEIIDQVDPDDAVARKFLGYTDFQGDILEMVLEPGGDPIPEAISNRKGYPFLDAVVTFNDRRWLQDEDDIALAKRAVSRMKKHKKLLETDHKYRAGDTIRANIAAQPDLMELNYASIWRPPYLICYSSSESLSDFDLLKEPDYKKRKKMKADMAAKRKDWTRTLEEKAKVFKGAYDEFMKRYADRFGLKPLEDPYGGRPDYKVGVRTYEDGVPMCIWIFTDHKAFQEYHVKYKGGPLPAGVAGYFMPTTGWIFLFDDKATKEDRIFEINKQIHEAVHQLEWWFTQQRSKWGKSRTGQNAISEGIAEYLGSVNMDKYRNLEYIEVEFARLRNMQNIAKQMEGRQREYPVFPLKKLVEFTTYQQARSWGAAEWGVPEGMVMGLLYQQAWAVTYFFHTYKNGKYKENWQEHFDAVLQRETQHGMAQQVFKRAFKIRDDDDWDDLQDEWETWLKEDLLKRDWRKYMKDPVPRETWPDDYPWPIDPLGDGKERIGAE